MLCPGLYVYTVTCTYINEKKQKKTNKTKKKKKKKTIDEKIR